jgi:transposase InsO family protein
MIRFAVVIPADNPHGRQAPARHPLENRPKGLTSDEARRRLSQFGPNATPWTSAPAYLVRDNDRAYGHVFTSRVRAMGIRDRPISPHSPWQNGYAERLIGTLRRECLDQIAIFGEKHLRRILFA